MRPGRSGEEDRSVPGERACHGMLLLGVRGASGGGEVTFGRSEVPDPMSYEEQCKRGSGGVGQGALMNDAVKLPPSPSRPPDKFGPEAYWATKAAGRELDSCLAKFDELVSTWPPIAELLG
eukprot:2283021-Pyramimonas_sp.AAC.1